MTSANWDALLVGGLQWLRWFSLGAVLALAVALFIHGRISAVPVFIILAVAAYNGGVHLAGACVRWLRSYRNIAWLDMFVITAAVYTCDDPNCPAQLLYFLAAISGAVSMRVRESLLFAGLLGLLSVLTTIGAPFETISMSVALDSAGERFVALVVFAGLASLLVRRLLVVRDEATREHVAAHRLSLLNELLWQANATYPDLDRLMPTMARLIHQALDGHLALTALLPGKEERPSAWASGPIKPGQAERLAGSLVVADAVALKDAAVVWDAQSDTRCADPVFSALGIRSCIVAPLCDGDRVFGAVLIAAPTADRFARTDVELLMALATHAALPIRNARLHSLEHDHATRLAELEKSKRDFLNVASHELRTPLAAAKLSQDVFAARLADRLSSDERSLLDSVERNTRRLERLVEDSLLLARLQGGSVQLRLEPLDLGQAIRAAIAELEPELKRKQQRTEAASGQSVVMADGRWLRRILVSLLSNASKFSPAETRITVEADARDQAVTVAVVDQGPGIPPEDRERVFQPFVRLAAEGCEGRGAGLGLPVARVLVELHGGRLWAEAGPAGGSAFRFTLPLQPNQEGERQ